MQICLGPIEDASLHTRFTDEFQTAKRTRSRSRQARQLPPSRTNLLLLLVAPELFLQRDSAGEIAVRH